MSITDDNDNDRYNVVSLVRPAKGEAEENDDWLSRYKYEAVLLIRPTNKHRSARGVTGSDLVELHCMEKRGRARLVRLVVEHLSPEVIKWVCTKDFSVEWELVEILSEGRSE